MTRIRRVEINNFRGIQHLDWNPSEGINCLIGPGDSGKSTILDAIDICLGARRNVVFYDTDFHNLDVGQPLVISITLGDLPDALKNIESYGIFLRGYDNLTDTVEDEPEAFMETALTLRLTVSDDLEPSWTLFSERALTEGFERNLAWKDRLAIAPARIGHYTNSHLSWARGSILNRLTEERANLGAELADAARQARLGFGTQAATQLAATLKIATDTANDLGVSVGKSVQALLDAHAVTLGSGAISLHSEKGVPLQSLGTGSTRLLVAGLQRVAAKVASIVLVDEVEHGLEPHRLTRLLTSLGAKEAKPPSQVFMTTHSPVAVRELTGDQLVIVRKQKDGHKALRVGTTDEIQSTVRADPEAFLAKSVIVCEGASEVGLARGLDQYWETQGYPSFFALGGSYVDVGGRTADLVYQRGTALCRLGYRVLVLADSDKPPTAEVVERFRHCGGEAITWQEGHALEDELFLSLSESAVEKLLSYAVELLGEELVDSHIKAKSNGALNLEKIWLDFIVDGCPVETRGILAKAAKSNRTENCWFKSVTKYQHIAKNIVGPDKDTAEPSFRKLISQIRDWMHVA